MRVVVDTNVFVSASLKRNSRPAAALAIVQTLTSDECEAELWQVLGRARFASKVGTQFIDDRRSLMQRAERVVIRHRVLLCRDPKDNRFLELAVNGRAQVLVSGDEDLLALRSVEAIPIIDAAAFLRLYAG
jgi:putative PIN family toxin of toxin-antitoxin system